MTDEFDRLRAANPATNTTYTHGDLAAVARRAELPTPNKTTRFAQGFRLKMASAAMAASLLTSGGIVALESSSSPLPVLTLGAASSSTANNSASLPTLDKTTDSKIAGGSQSAMAIWGTYEFSASDSLSTSPSQAPVYRVAGVSDGNALTIDLAKALGIFDSAVDIKVTDGYAGLPVKWYEYTTDNGTISVTVSENSATTWYFSSPAAGVSSNNSLNVNTITKPELAAWSDSVIDGLRFNLSLSDATYSIYGDQGSVNYQVLVGGIATDLSVSLGFDNQGTVLWAYGSVATFDRMGNYPLISERDGVDNLSSGSPYGGGPVAMTERVANGVASSDVMPAVGSDDVLTPPVMKVLITSAAVQLSAEQMTDGSVWLIPMYSYTGTVTNADGTTTESTWSTVAVDPAYLKISVHPSPIAY
ncbi:unannotated protein [freshwater metagenome]|uniref:Unannotated protein n=1 Tax=freshwater metagenome TaxID=449393 RepID=A0A6J7DE13_9ZZZZ|nr:hypothetical protein [Actinomycetota bacterium]